MRMHTETDSAAATAQFVHAHRVDADRCRGHMACMRHCPTQAIRVRGGRAVISADLCIDCGICIAACPGGAIVSVTPPFPDISPFKYRVAVPSGALYSQFDPSIHPYVIHLAIKQLGFDEVVDVAPTSAAVARVLVKYMKDHAARFPLISSYCPSTLRLIQVKYPNLVEHVVPFDVPREITARELKRTLPERLGLAPDEVGVFYVSPCLAKIVSIMQPAEKDSSCFDGVVSIRDFYPLLRPHVLAAKEHFDERQVPRGYCFSAGWSAFGGMTRAVQGENWLAVSGIDQVIRIFDDIENSKLRHVDFVEALACMLGCSGGTLNVESPYVARANSVKARARYEGRFELDDELIGTRQAAGYYDLQHPVTPRPTRYFDTDLETSLKRMKEINRLFQKLRQTDCGCCGAPTCMAFAEDCVRGQAKLTDCIFLAQGTDQG
jgi:iron only hydrogenase large subunit-like protein